MGMAELERSEIQDFFSGVAREGKVLASNSGGNVEERYPVAYNLGSGRARWRDWINVDSRKDADIQSDLRDLSAIESDSADAVAAIHVLEHFYVWEVPALLTEWKRILKPGGKMILELPCADKVFGYVVQCIQKGESMAEFMTLYALYGDPKYKDPVMCHRWIWFTEPLHRMLESVGMREITDCDPRYHFPFRDMRIESLK